MRRKFLASLCLLLLGNSVSSAAIVAVFGDNGIDNYYNSLGPGFTATLVSDAQIATPGFLSAFDALVMTRNGSSFGTGLSALASANVAAYVGATGNVALLNADYADGVPGAVFEQNLVGNAIAFAAASGHGFVGEFNGAVAALTANSSGFVPIGLITGSAGPLGFGNGGSEGTISLTPAGVGHAVTSGLSFPVNPGSVEFGATISGVSSALVLATFDNGNPAIIARTGTPGAVPEASSLLTFAGLGLCAAGAWWKKSRRA